MRRLLTLAAGILAISAGISLLPGCASDNLEDLAGPNLAPCDTTAEVTYSGVIRPLIQQNCLECHSAAVHTDGVVLETYEQVKAKADDRTVANTPLLVGVTSRLSGFPQMPYGKAPLSKCDMNRIRQWVRLGAKNN